jgi:hypothetical protein
VVVLYLETNFLMSVAKGQDPQADILLQNTPSSVRLVIPGICYVEALSIWEKEKEYSQQFQRELDKQINDSGRDNSSSYAKSFVSSLEQSRLLNKLRLNDIQNRLSQAIDQLVDKAEIITLIAEIVQEISEITLIKPETFLIKNDLMDNLILRCIIGHARLHSTEDKVFLSGNNKDFGKPEVQEALRDAGVDKYFTRTQNFLGWLQSQST